MGSSLLGIMLIGKEVKLGISDIKRQEKKFLTMLPPLATSLVGSIVRKYVIRKGVMRARKSVAR